MIRGYETIQELFNRVITYSQGIDNPKTDFLFELWADSKEYIYERFGERLIYEVPGTVSFQLGEQEKTDRAADFVCRVDSVYRNEHLANFLDSNLTSFYENKVEKDYPLLDGQVIQAGTKLIKAFKYFEKDPTCLAQMQTEASMLIQENKIEGTLCFSIHPLDYLSSSENTYNWRSCHALDGDYRSGNISYMGDPTTIVCYLKGANNIKLPRFPNDVLWNSKKWRMLLTYDQHSGIMFAGRQYPFQSGNALEIITPYLRDALRQADWQWSGWHNDAITAWTYKDGTEGTHGIFKSVPIGGRIYALEDIVIDKHAHGGEALHFNDLLRSSCYSPFYSWNLTHWRTRPPHISVGSEQKCLCCGEEYITLGDTFCCQDCRD